MNQRRTGRRQRDVGGDGVIAENLLLTVADPRGRDQQLRAVRVAQRRKVDVAQQRLPQRIEIERIEMSGAQRRPERDRASRRREAADQHQRAERSLVHQPDPEPVQPGAGAFAAAFGEAGGEQQRVDRTGAGAADAVDLDGWMFQQPLQHAPGKGGKGAAALERQRQSLWRPFLGRRFLSRHGSAPDRARSARRRVTISTGFGASRIGSGLGDGGGTGAGSGAASGEGTPDQISVVESSRLAAVHAAPRKPPSSCAPTIFSLILSNRVEPCPRSGRQPRNPFVHSAVIRPQLANGICDIMQKGCRGIRRPPVYPFSPIRLSLPDCNRLMFSRCA